MNEWAAGRRLWKTTRRGCWRKFADQTKPACGRCSSGSRTQGQATSRFAGDGPLRSFQALRGCLLSEVEQVIQAFEGRDLLVRRQRFGEIRVDLMHESVMWHWTRLKGWIDEEAAQAMRLRFYREAADKELVLTGSTLEEAKDACARAAVSPAWAARYLGDGASVETTVAWVGESERRVNADLERERQIVEALDKAKEREIAGLAALANRGCAGCLQVWL